MAKKINQIIDDFEHTIGSITRNINENKDKLDFNKSNLSQLLLNFDLGIVEIQTPQVVDIDKSYNKWIHYIEDGAEIFFTKDDIFNLTFNYSVICDPRFWQLIEENNLVDERNICAFVRMTHYFWKDIPNLNNVIKIIKRILKNFKSDKRIYKKWRNTPNIIFGTKEKSLEKQLLTKIEYQYINIDMIYRDKYLNIKERDLIANLIQYEYLYHLIERNDDNVLEEIFTQFSKFFLYSVKPKFMNTDTRKVSQTLIKKRNTILALLITMLNKKQESDLKIEYKQKLIDFILDQNDYGDPRTNKWEQFEDINAENIFIYWLNEKDIKFFFECLTVDENDVHYRKNFWLQYADKITSSCFLIGNAQKNSTYNTELKKLEKAYKNRFYNTQRLDTHVFILRIKDIVYLEFSEYSNACYVYDYLTYKKEIKPCFNTMNSRNKIKISDLKNKTLAKDNFKHSGRWRESLSDFIDSHYY